MKKLIILLILALVQLNSFAKPKVELGLSFGQVYPYLKKDIGLEVLNKPGKCGTFHLDLNYYKRDNPVLYFSLSFMHGYTTFDVMTRRSQYGTVTYEPASSNVFYTGITGSLQYRLTISDALTLRACVIAGPTADIDLNNYFFSNKLNFIAGVGAGLMFAERVTLGLSIEHYFGEYEYDIVRKHDDDPRYSSNIFGINSIRADLKFLLGNAEERHSKWWH